MRIAILSVVAFLISSLAFADDKKDLYDKGSAAANAGDALIARNAFCELAKKGRHYKDASQQCLIFTDVAERAEIRYKLDFAEGMTALQSGDFGAAEEKFRRVKGGPFAEQAKQKLATIDTWKSQYPATRRKRQRHLPSILFGEAEITLGMSQRQVERELSNASRHLKLGLDKAATVIADRDDSMEGQITFEHGEASYVVSRIQVKTPGELAKELAAAIETVDDKTCHLQTIPVTETSNKSLHPTMFCGAYVISVITETDASSGNSITRVVTEIGAEGAGSTQVRQFSTVLGTVFDRKGAPMPGVVVLLENKNTGFIKTSMTAADGSYSIKFVPMAMGYKITASKMDGTQIGDAREGIDINPGDEREIIPPLREPPPHVPQTR